MRYIFVKEGEYRPSAFADLVETVNRDDFEQVGFYSRMDQTLRLIRNRTDTNATHPLAVAHYCVDPTDTAQNPKLFRGVDINLMTAALDQYDYVLFGIVTDNHVVKDYGLVEDARYIVRDANGKLLDFQTGELIRPDSTSVTFMITFCGMVKVNGIPAYYLILDPKLLHVTDGFDYYHAATDTKFILLSDHDGNLKDNVFAPEVDDAKLFGNIILTPNQSCAKLTFFKGEQSALRCEHTPTLIQDIFYKLDTNCLWSLCRDTGAFIIHPPTTGPGYFSIHFDCGKFFNLAHPSERPHFNYIIMSSSCAVPYEHTTN